MSLPRTIPSVKAGQVPRSPLWVRIAFWISIGIAVAVVLRRLAALAAPSAAGPPPMVKLDRTFASHATLTLAHILPALLFVLLAPLIVFRKTRKIVFLELA